jgi:hypothetical protein
VARLWRFFQTAALAMLVRILADLVALSHLAFIVFALLGGLLALRWRWLPLAHLPAAAWAVAVEFLGWFCPLTPLENWLREASGSAGYPGGFIEHYLLPLIYPAELTRELQKFAGWVVVVFNLAVYLVVWRRLCTREVVSSLAARLRRRRE